MSTCNWPLGNGETLEFTAYDSNENWKAVAGLYIFAFVATNGYWTPLYVGQTDDFSVRLPSHERLNEAVQLGATHIHAAVISTQPERDRLERMLIEHLQPSMNSQFR